ncbi:Auxin-responsive protein IAA27 [Zea mays]|uniref:Auxin-responsive protein n=1 Tax=Zea mays TaxID=4577 RepID=A0A1D6IX98_MAIZE|nr:Auxin-responsive protein IAA27 [Zea mays]
MQAQVVGWPPVRNYRKNTLAAATASRSKAPTEEAASGAGPMYVKVSMDGAPYLRKVDIKMYSSYEDLSLALEKMFSCFIAGQSGLHKSSSKDRLTNGSKVDALKDQEYVLTYEDKDADWMLVGDLPWDYFTSICRKLKIMRGSDAATAVIIRIVSFLGLLLLFYYKYSQHGRERSRGQAWTHCQNRKFGSVPSINTSSCGRPSTKEEINEVHQEKQKFVEGAKKEVRDRCARRMQQDVQPRTGGGYQLQAHRRHSDRRARAPQYPLASALAEELSSSPKCDNYLCDANRSGELPNNLYLLVAQFFLVEVWALDTMVVNSLEKGVLFPFFFGRRSGLEPESP